MAGIVDGRVVVITGSGAGIGREHALAFAAEGAKVVVNDLGDNAQAVVEEIKAAGGEAVANNDNVADFEGAKRLVQQAIDTYGTLHVLVNNAGILRDKMLANLGEAEWDAVINVHLKGTYAPTHHAAQYWREQSKAGTPVDARVINTTSSSGVFGNVGQSNYGAAKAGIAAFTIITSQELGRYGVTVNAIAPTAATAMTETIPGFSDINKAMSTHDFEYFAPGNVSPVLVYLGSEQASGITGRVFSVAGGSVTVLEGWVNGPQVDKGAARWEAGELAEVLPDLVKQAAPNANTMGTRDQ